MIVYCIRKIDSFIIQESCYNELEMKVRDKFFKERSQQPCKEWSNMNMKDIFFKQERLASKARSLLSI